MSDDQQSLTIDAEGNWSDPLPRAQPRRKLVTRWSNDPPPAITRLEARTFWRTVMRGMVGRRMTNTLKNHRENDP